MDDLKGTGPVRHRAASRGAPGFPRAVERQAKGRCSVATGVAEASAPRYWPPVLAVFRPIKLPSKSARARAESKALWNEARSPERADFFTIGYEGRTTKDLFDSLQHACVQCVLDIRFNPVSMYRPELSKGNLQTALERQGIAYFHLREWGVPREVRARAAELGSRESIWRWYDESVIAQNFGRNLHRFLNFGYPVAMLCMECDPAECHRHRIL